MRTRLGGCWTAVRDRPRRPRAGRPGVAAGTGLPAAASASSTEMPKSVARPDQARSSSPAPSARNFQPSPRRYSSPQISAVSSPVSGSTSKYASGSPSATARVVQQDPQVPYAVEGAAVRRGDEQTSGPTAGSTRGQIRLDRVGQALGDLLLAAGADQARGVPRLVVEDEVLVGAHPTVGAEQQRRGVHVRDPRARASSAARPAPPWRRAGRSSPSASRASCGHPAFSVLVTDNAGATGVRRVRVTRTLQPQWERRPVT